MRVFSRSRPAGILRLVFRLPTYLYRYRFGRLLGHRFLLLTHRGRKTGRVHQTVLEVIAYDSATRESIVLSGWGERADWYRNIEANPAMEIRIGRERYVPKQRFLSPEEVYAEIPLTSVTIRGWYGPYPGGSATRSTVHERRE